MAYEHYASLAAALSHLDHFGVRFAGRMQATVAYRRVFIVESSPQVRDRIIGLGAGVVRGDGRPDL